MSARLSWPERYRAALVRYPTMDGRQAERRAYGTLLNEWASERGTKHDPANCAGCGKKIDSSPLVEVFEKAVVHLGGNYGVECVIQYGEKWRGEAQRGLEAVGVKAPSGWS